MLIGNKKCHSDKDNPNDHVHHVHIHHLHTYHVHIHRVHVHLGYYVHVQWTLSTMSMSIRLRLRLMTLMVEVSLTDSVKVSLVELGYPLNSWEHTRLQTGWVLDGLDRITNPHSV